MRSSITIVFLGLLTACTVDVPPGRDAAFPDAPAVDAGRDAGRLPCESPGSTLGASCTSLDECNDGCRCNGVERCVEGACVAGVGPCADEHACTDEVCDEATFTCTLVPHDDRCDDGAFCTGIEICDPEYGCLEGLPPACADGDPCTISHCDAALDACVPVLRDLDGDGAGDERCGGTDCNDDPADGADVHPGVAEICDNGRDDDCDDRVDFLQDSCAASNDTCAEAELLSGPGIYTRTTRGADDDLPLGCAPSGVDVVFRVHLAMPQDLTASVVAEGAGASVAIRALAECETGPDRVCRASTATARGLAAGDYAVVVRTTTAARFELTLAYSSSTPVGPIDTCSSSTPDVGGGGTFNGLFADIHDDYRLSCRTSGSAAEVAYRLVLTETSDVRLTATTAGTTTPSTYLALVRDCTAPATTVACVQRATAEISRRTLPPGTYFVLLEAGSSSATSYSLNVDVRAALPRNEGDACTTEVDITNASATLPISMLSLDDGTTCGGMSSTTRDASFSFTTTAEQDVVVRSELGSPHFLAVSRECGDLSTEILCTSGTPSIERRLVRLPAGTYHVTVASGLSSGDLIASTRIEPPTVPPTNDTCGSPAELLDAVPVRSSLGASVDDVPSCGAAGSPDTMHRLLLTERRHVTMIARRTDGSSEPLALGLRGACSGASTELACASGAPAVIDRTLDAGTYHVVVESSAAFAGPYIVTAYLAEP